MLGYKSKMIDFTFRRGYYPVRMFGGAPRAVIFGAWSASFGKLQSTRRTQMSWRYFLKCVCVTLGVSIAAMATAVQAQIISWDIDPALSAVQLTIPDQSVSFPGITTTIQLRNPDGSAWTNAGGRQAALDGTINTNYLDGVSVQFLGGTHNIFALEQTNLRPNPASFNPANVNSANPDGQYSGTSTAPAAYGARIRATGLDAAYMAIRNVKYNIISSGAIPLGGGTTIGGSTTDFGISSGSIDVDGLSIFLVGQQIQDIRDGALSPIIGTNTASGTITNLGGGLRRLTYNISETVSINLDGTILNGTASGTIVAFATVPEPGSFVLGGIGLIALVGWRIRQRRIS
jgi:hypothetical protein